MAAPENGVRSCDLTIAFDVPIVTLATGCKRTVPVSRGETRPTKWKGPIRARDLRLNSLLPASERSVVWIRSEESSGRRAVLLSKESNVNSRVLPMRACRYDSDNPAELEWLLR